MSAKPWWVSSLPTKFDQGDIFIDVPFLLPTAPIKPLIGCSLKGGVAGWAEAKTPKFDGNKMAHYLACGPTRAAMIINHGCDIDKPTNRRLIAVPLALLDEIPKDQRDVVQSQGAIAQFYLPDVPGLGDCVADFRIMSSIPTEVIASAERQASMTTEARALLGARLLEFFLRKSESGK